MPEMSNTGYTISGSSGQPMTIEFNTAQSSTIPFYLVPATPVAVEIDDSSLAWLRSQVEEIAELARAA